LVVFEALGVATFCVSFGIVEKGNIRGNSILKFHFLVYREWTILEIGGVGLRTLCLVIFQILEARELVRIKMFF
jgi:hypothetical protein